MGTHQSEADEYLAGMFIVGRLLLGIGGVVVGAVGPVLVAELAYPGTFSYENVNRGASDDWGLMIDRSSCDCNCPFKHPILNGFNHRCLGNVW